MSKQVQVTMARFTDLWTLFSAAVSVEYGSLEHCDEAQDLQP